METTWGRPAARPVYVALAWALAAAVVAQVFLAGLAVTSDPSWWPVHRVTGHLVEFVALAALLVARLGRGGARRVWPPAILLGLVFAQSVLIHVPVGWVRALHPTNALAVFAVALLTVARARE